MSRNQHIPQDRMILSLASCIVCMLCQPVLISTAAPAGLMGQSRLLATESRLLAMLKALTSTLPCLDCILHERRRWGGSGSICATAASHAPETCKIGYSYRLQESDKLGFR